MAVENVDGRWSSTQSYSATNKGLTSITTTGVRKLGEGFFYFEITTPSSGDMTYRSIGLTETNSQAWVSGGNMPKTKVLLYGLQLNTKYGVELDLTSSSVGKARYSINNGKFTEWVELSDYASYRLTQFRPMIMGSSSSNTDATFIINSGQNSMTYLQGILDHKTYSFDGSLESTFNKILLSSGGKQYSFEKVVKKSAVPIMTSASNNDVEITASANYSSDYPWKAFDGVVSSTDRPFWYAQSGPPSGGHWLQVKFKNPKVINGISLISLLVTGASHSIKDFELYGSNDGVVFEKLYSGTQLNAITKMYYDFENIKSYSYYRLNILSSYNTTSTVGVAEMEIFEKPIPTIYVLDSSGESAFSQYGMEGDIPFNKAVDKVKDVIKMNSPLGSSKTFEHTIDIAKRRVDRITFG
ncbi:discoidin domain-containing protein [Paenibacillus taichungensis]